MSETASCFVHGDFDAALRRCPKCGAGRGSVFALTAETLCAHGCATEATVQHADGRLLCRGCYEAEVGVNGGMLGCPTCAPQEKGAEANDVDEWVRDVRKQAEELRALTRGFADLRRSRAADSQSVPE